MSEEIPEPPGDKHFRWDYKQQPPMEDIAAAVAELSGGTVKMTFPFTGSDEHELVISRGNGERPAVFARFLRAVNPVMSDHDVADSWRWCQPPEVAFWREVETATGADL